MTQIHEVDVTIVRGIEDLLSRPSIPVGRQLIDQTLNRKRIKEVADKISAAILYLLHTGKMKREQTEDGVPKFWLSSRDNPTDAEGQVIRLVEGTSREFTFRLMNGKDILETNVPGAGDEIATARAVRYGAAAGAPTKVMMPPPQDRATQDQIASVMLQHGTPQQQASALAYTAAPAIANTMRDIAAEVDAEAEDTDAEEEEAVDPDEPIDDTPPPAPAPTPSPVVDGTTNFFHARMSELDGYRLDDQLVIAVGFWHNPVKEQTLLDFMAKYGVTKMGTVKLRLAHVVKVRQELTRIDRDDGPYYSIGPKSVMLQKRPKTASYKPKLAPTPQLRTVVLPVAPAVGTQVHVSTAEPGEPKVTVIEPIAKNAIELTDASKVKYDVDSEGVINIAVSGVTVLRFTPEAAAKLVHFTANIKGLYDL